MMERVTHRSPGKWKTRVLCSPTILFQHLYSRETPQPVHKKWIWLETTWMPMRRGKDESNVGGFQEDLLGSNWKEQPRKNGMQNDTLSKHLWKSTPLIYREGIGIGTQIFNWNDNVNYTNQYIHQKLKIFSFIL